MATSRRMPPARLQFVSLLDKVPAEIAKLYRRLADISYSPRYLFSLIRATVSLGWSAYAGLVDLPKSRFQALSAVRGHIYTSQNGIGLQEIVGRRTSQCCRAGMPIGPPASCFFIPYDETHILVSARDQLLTLYDGEKVTPFPHRGGRLSDKHKTVYVHASSGREFLHYDFEWRSSHPRARRQTSPDYRRGDGLPSSNALSAYQDREGALWLGRRYWDCSG